MVSAQHLRTNAGRRGVRSTLVVHNARPGGSVHQRGASWGLARVLLGDTSCRHAVSHPDKACHP